MSRLALASLLLLAACAAPASGLPVCNGAHRRPANANGSVLVAAPEPRDLKPDDQAAPEGTFASAMASYRPCEGRPG